MNFGSLILILPPKPYLCIYRKFNIMYLEISIERMIAMYGYIERKKEVSEDERWKNHYWSSRLSLNNWNKIGTLVDNTRENTTKRIFLNSSQFVRIPTFRISYLKFESITWSNSTFLIRIRPLLRISSVKGISKK